ncbi:hypothetical protein FZEAL_9374 [Fusarium zealandicum]|uniref:Rhodopsin domain-containing protein n=1 Tax=Fusarium zealandicum TaxID=1053134 RepID=A0A8H4UBC5_9HYPO|nr:hypothetical protein FZEAL_9374 [Fusarium zealandicum]
MASADIPTDSKQTQLSLVAWIFTGVAIFTVATKLITTTFVFRRPGWDDLMILLSLIGSVVASALVQASVDLGLGRHTVAVASEPGGHERMVLTKKIQVIAYPFNIVAYSLPNVAILILIERLAGRTETISRLFLRGIVTVQLILASVSIIIIFVQCQPTKYLWDQSIDGTCWGPNVFNYSSYIVSAVTAFTDLILAVIPTHAFWKLQLKTQEKWEITFMLGLTLLSAIFTVIKATYLHLFNDRIDPLYNIVVLIIWGLVEQNIVIMAASVSTLRPLLRLIHEKHPIRSTVGYIRSGSDQKGAESVSEIPLDSMKLQVVGGIDDAALDTASQRLRDAGFREAAWSYGSRDDPASYTGRHMKEIHLGIAEDYSNLDKHSTRFRFPTDEQAKARVVLVPFSYAHITVTPASEHRFSREGNIYYPDAPLLLES